ncbi:MAG TPA: hypothetical protein VFT22_34100 [Kofleriaceae bacterium]|nr:hypothetical protein [Kofleriaceae bacterium]
MLVRWKTVALLALLPALALAAPPKPRPTRKPPIKKPVKDATEPAATPAPEPTTEPAAKDTGAKAPEPAAAAPATLPGGGAGGTGTAGSAGGAGGGTADAAARPAESVPDRPADGADVDALRQEYLSLRDELFKSRARANAVASQLYSTRIQIKLTYTTGRYYNPARSSIRLDGANVYEDATGAISGDDGVRFDGYVAPGRHLITFRVEATGKDDDSFTSTTESQIVVKAVAGKDLLVAARARDSGDIAYEWKRSEHGSYGLGIDVAVKTTRSVEGAPAAAAPPPRPAGKEGKK